MKTEALQSLKSDWLDAAKIGFFVGSLQCHNIAAKYPPLLLWKKQKNNKGHIFDRFDFKEIDMNTLVDS